MDFLIIYERKLRELENAILLKIEIERRGYSCEIVQFYEADRYIKSRKLKPKVILAPHMYETKSIPRIFSRYGRANYLVNLQYEQVLSEDWEKIGHHNPKGEAIKAVHICWGPKTRDRLLSAGVPEKNIKVLGALQFDLLREEFRIDNNSLKKQMGKLYNLPANRRWTLFLSSFTFADMSKARLEMNESVAKTDLSNFVTIYTSSRSKILEWFRKILKEDKDNIIVYRPHPDELSLSRVIELEKEFSNFRIIREQPVKMWIESCDSIFSWISTSVIEAHFLKKKYSILRPFQLPSSFDSVILKNADFITKYEDFEKVYFEYDEDQELPIKDMDIKQYYDFDNEYSSFYRYVNMLEDLIKLGEKQDYILSNKEVLKANIITLGVKFVYYLYKRLGMDLDSYRNRDRNNFFIRWFIEFDDQIASKEEKKIIEDRIKNVIKSIGYNNL